MGNMQAFSIKKNLHKLEELFNQSHNYLFEEYGKEHDNDQANTQP